MNNSKFFSKIFFLFASTYSSFIFSNSPIFSPLKNLRINHYLFKGYCLCEYAKQGGEFIVQKREEFAWAQTEESIEKLRGILESRLHVIQQFALPKEDMMLNQVAKFLKGNFIKDAVTIVASLGKAASWYNPLYMEFYKNSEGSLNDIFNARLEELKKICVLLPLYKQCFDKNLAVIQKKVNETIPYIIIPAIQTDIKKLTTLNLSELDKKSSFNIFLALNFYFKRHSMITELLPSEEIKKHAKLQDLLWAAEIKDSFENPNSHFLLSKKHHGAFLTKMANGIYSNFEEIMKIEDREKLEKAFIKNNFIKDFSANFLQLFMNITAIIKQQYAEHHHEYPKDLAALLV